MGAPRENQFWKLRSEHGRKKLFKTPKLLWDAACEYFTWCDKNPLKEQKAFHSQGKIVKTTVHKMRAYTLGGFLLYVGANEAYLRTFKGRIKKKTDKKSKDFDTVIIDIEQTIYNQKFTGASADLLNANIISRDLGLADRREVEITDLVIDIPEDED